MEVQLKVLVGGNAGQMLKVPGPKFFIGRAEDCHLRPGSDLVSRHHCVLMLEGSTLIVRDFGSKNGTQVNGERVNVESELKHGDHLKVGPLEFEVQVIEAPVSAKRPKVTSIKEAALRTAESSSNKEFDIGDWLSGGDHEMGDTREINRADTAEFDMSTTKINAPKSTPAPEPEPEPVAPSAPAPASKVPGKLPPHAKKGEDSQNAAAEMLKRLKRRT